MTEAALRHAHTQSANYVDALMELLRIPSISGLPEHTPDLREAASWLAEYLSNIGMQQVRLVPTEGLPVVYGEWLGAGADAPTLLAYGHYDVQPVDPLAAWHSPPFEPVIRGEYLYARGASDDKGQILAILSAAEAYLTTQGHLPINLKIMLEGEEEISSPHMTAFVQANAETLASDAALVCDEALLDPAVPLIMYGVRGSIYMEMVVCGPAGDLHSGTFGGAVDNPFNVLVRLLAQLQDSETRRIKIPGFYDDVQPLGASERALLARVPITDEVARRLAGVRLLAGEEGYSTLERVSVRPTLDIHGLPGGFTSPGKKTVIPARASAKVSMRLVPDQEPDQIARLFENYVRSIAPPTVQLEFRVLGKSRPAVIDYRAPAIEAMAQAFAFGFGAQPVYMRGGGSEPVVRILQEQLQVPVVLIGFGLPDDNIHAPNEKYFLPNFHRGIDTLIHYFAILAQSLKTV